MRAPLRTLPPPERHDIDDVTLARARRGDDAAFRAVVEHYQQPVFAYLWRMLGARAERTGVEDLVQDTFVRMHRGLPRFDPAGAASLRTWILTIATRVALNALRKRAPRTEPMTARTHEIPQSRADAALGLVVRDAIDHLAPAHRAVLVLREYHALDYAEIARVLDIDLGTVRSRLSRARAALRTALTEDP